MRWVLLLGVVVACNADRSARPTPKPPRVANVTTVREASTLGTLAPDAVGRLPVVVAIDDASALHITAVSTLEELVAHDPFDGKRIGLHAVGAFIAETSGLMRDPEYAIEQFDPALYPDDGDDADDIPEWVEDTSAVDDEPTATGTAQALDDQRYGSRPSSRLHSTAPAMTDAQREALAEARRVMGPLGKLERRRAPDAPRVPVRVATMAGLVVGEFRDERALVVASPRARASTVIAVLEQTQGVLVVRHDNEMRPLRLDVRHFDPPWDTRRLDGVSKWIEVRVGDRDIEIEAVPDRPHAIAWPIDRALDHARLAATLAELRRSRDIDARAPIDVVVTADVTAQRFVDVLVAVELGGARVIGIGTIPTTSARPAIR